MWGAALVALTGFGYGLFLALFPSVLAAVYGYQRFASLWSLVQAGAVVSCLGFPPLATALRKSTGSYTADTAGIALLLAASAGALFAVKRP